MRIRLSATAPWLLVSLIGCGGPDEVTTVETVAGVEVVTKTIKNPDGTTTTSTSYHQPNKELPPPFQSTDGNYRVTFPGEPKVSEETRPTPFGDQTVHVAHFVERRSSFTVAWNVMPKEILQSQSREQFIDRTIENALKAQGWTALETQGVMVGPHAARDIKVEATSLDGGPAGLGWWRMALIGDRLYQLMAIGPKGTGGGELQHDFVRSFALLTDVPITPAPQPVAPPTDAAKAADATSPEVKPEPPTADVPPTTDPGSSSGGATFVHASWIDDQQDRVGENGPDGGKPNGKNDEHVRIELKLPENTRVESVVLARRDSNDRWESKPSDRFWPVAVYQGDQTVTAGHADTVGVFSGDQAFDLYCSTGSPLDHGAKLDVEVGLTIDGQGHTIRGTCEKTGGPTAAQQPAARPGLRRAPLGRRAPARRR